VQALAANLILRGGTAPEVEVNASRDGLGGVHLADGAAGLVAGAVDGDDFAKLAGLHEFHGLANADTGGAALGAGLDDLLVFAGGVHELAAFPDVVGDGFLDVNILARLHGPDGSEGMPVIGRGDGDDVDVLVFEHLPDVGVSGDFDALLVLGIHALAEDGVVHVAEGGETDAGILQAAEGADVRAAPAVEADHD